MTDKKSDKKKGPTQPVDISHEEMEGLKRDMRSARLIAWAIENQRTLLAAGIAVLLLIAGVGLWTERMQSQRNSAAVLYHQSLEATDSERKIKLLKSVVQDYDSTFYSPMALMLLSRLDAEQAEKHLQALLSRSGLTPEIEWQARLDMASIKLKQGDAKAASAVLARPVGAHYEQLRFYLLGMASDSVDEKRGFLNKALAAVSHDSELKKIIKSRLAELAGTIKSDQ